LVHRLGTAVALAIALSALLPGSPSDALSTAPRAPTAAILRDGSSIASPVYSPWWTGSTQVTQQWGCTPFSFEDIHIPAGHTCPGTLPQGTTWHWHHGVDLQDLSTYPSGVGCSNGSYGPGTTIYAGRAGTVTHIESAWFQVNYNSNVYISLYHEQQVFNDPATGQPIAQGAQVVLGEALVMVGNLGNSTGCHLHFEVDIGWSLIGWNGSNYDVDPSSYLLPVASVSAVTPTGGQSAGGTTVVITGRGFTGLSGPRGVNFGVTMATSYVVNSDTQITAISPTEDAGTIDVTVTNGGVTSAISTTDKFSFDGCSSLSAGFLPSQPPPAPVGTTVLMTASAGGCPNPLYRFWIYPPGGPWYIVRDYVANGSYNWNTTDQRAGNYSFEVWVRDASSAGSSTNSLGTYDAFTDSTYSLTGSIAPSPTPCTSLTAQASPSSGQASGTVVTITAAATGCPNPLFEFWIEVPPTTTWRLAQAYSAASFAWYTNGVLSGTYYYVVYVRDSSSPGSQAVALGSYDRGLNAISYALTATPCTAQPNVSITPSNSAVASTVVTITATQTGCTNPRYAFWILPPSSSTWQLGHNYGPAVSFHWNTTFSIGGTYNYVVWVRDASSSGSHSNSLGSFDTGFGAAAYTLTVTPCTSGSAWTAPTTPSTVGTSITITATASGCPYPLYQFWILPAGSSTWQLRQAYSTTTAFTWSTTGLAAGLYYYAVWSRDTSSAGTTTNSLGSFDWGASAAYHLN